MGTDYYLADPMYMNPSEIHRAHQFEQDTLLCHRSGGRDPNGKPHLVYTLEVPNIIFFNLPRDVLLVNSNNDIHANTLGELINQIERLNSKIITVTTAEEMRREAKEQWLRTRPDTAAWNSFLDQYVLLETPSVMHYIFKARQENKPN